jgi:cytochrome c551/c552
MSRLRSLVFAVAATTLYWSGTVFAQGFPGIGRAATTAEIAAWDIDVRPDFQGLPKGSGSVDAGMELWEAKCASCHGVFGESNQVFTPIVGGTTEDDMKTGRVANLRRADYPQRTTFMKVPTLSTLFDYVRRAMPWNEPKSLSDDEVYAVLAFMLNLADVVPNDFVLSDANIRDIQAKMPNRNGMTTQHGLWYGAGFGSEQIKPDVKAVPCMKDCRPSVAITSSLPDYAWPSHGNLAAQQRRIGPMRGRVTGDEDPDSIVDDASREMKLAQSSGCMACHAVNNKVVGPSYADIAMKYRGQSDLDPLIVKVLKGGEGVWGNLPMPAQVDVKESDARTLVEWILAGAPAK